MPSIFTEISKELGFEGRHVEIPTAARAASLILRANGGDRDAFRCLFAVVRFAERPLQPSRAETFDHIVEAFHGARHLFSKPIPSDEPADPEDDRKWNTI